MNEVKYCDAHNIEFSGSPEDYEKEYVAVDDILNLDEKEWNLQLLKKSLSKTTDSNES
ncbi:MAG: hypothetical protein ACQERX_06400 [Bacillota bacterium]